MAKRDLINEIITEFPDRGYTAEQLDKEYSVPQLEKLHEDLRAGRATDTPPDGVAVPPVDATPDAAATGTATDTATATRPGAEEGEGRVAPELSAEAKAEQDRVAAAVEEGNNKKYKLANPDTQFSEGTFTLTGDQEKELPDDPSPDLLARIRAGFIVEA